MSGGVSGGVALLLSGASLLVLLLTYLWGEGSSKIDAALADLGTDPDEAWLDDVNQPVPYMPSHDPAHDSAPTLYDRTLDDLDMHLWSLELGADQ